MQLKLAYGREKLQVEFPEGAPVTVAQVLRSVKDTRPDVYERWCDEGGRLHGSLNIFINRENIRYRKGLETELSDGDEVYIIPMVTGG